MAQHRLLFVCLGNICRSPIAQGVFGDVAARAGMADRFFLDSAGTGTWHIGNPPDPRAAAAAARRGIDISGQRARQVRAHDFSDFDLLLAMDRTNQSDLCALAPEPHTAGIRLFLADAPELGVAEVPDPYFGGNDGFEEVLDLVEAGSRALLARLA
ncbi:low molecular weight protein-tyrosine-phosphatase YfkJ [bacterium BMS3Bbin10]|nr:low molecular weight protein-tyrosine-phosphatase YfkJ [bacterium BMS3Bbin10]HDL16582.1 low molecular weight phosphotyrosine protein phosphatase [Hyphomicrobiales bacterium]